MRGTDGEGEDEWIDIVTGSKGEERDGAGRDCGVVLESSLGWDLQGPKKPNALDSIRTSSDNGQISLLVIIAV